MLNIKRSDIDALSAALYYTQNGQLPDNLPVPPEHTDDEWGQLLGYFNGFLEQYREATAFVYSLSRGELDTHVPRGKLQIIQSFKSLQASLKHLTWKTQQIAQGDFNHQVDFMGDFSIAFNDMTRQLKEAFSIIQEQNSALTEANKIIEKERAKSDALLNNILPEGIVDELKSQGTTTPMLYPDVTVYFSDIVGFTDQASHLDAATLIAELNTLFAQFDCIVDATYGERIKTIGDAYLAVWGMHHPLTDHVEKAIEAAIKIVECLEMRNAESNIKWQIRIGIHTGPVIGGVVGVSKFIYDIFGDTVNIASRLQSSSKPMHINISDDVYQRASSQVQATYRGVIPVKGKGEIKMYYVNAYTGVAHL